MRLLLFVLILWLPHFLFSQPLAFLPDENAGARQRNVDFIHLNLNVALSPDSGKVKGTATYTFSPIQQVIDTLFMDAPGITIFQAKINNKTVPFTTSERGIVFQFDPPLTAAQNYQLFIDYEASPKKGIYFIGWNEPEPQNPVLANVRRQIWTQGQGIDNRHWIPLFDDMSDKLTHEIKIAFDSNYMVLSNGNLVASKKQNDGNTFWHYKMDKPHAPYLIMLGIGKYQIKKSKTKSGVPVNNWYYPEFPETVEPTFRYTENMIEWMEQEFETPYPWYAYSQIPVQDFIFGAMENTTATVFGDFYVVDQRAYLDRNYVSTNAHELVHQWFGDFITAWSAEDAWLQESFATHYQKHFERSLFGEDHFQWNRKRELDRVLAAAKTNNHPIRHTQAGSARIYPKGSLVLDMLRYTIGDHAYKKSVAHYLKKHAYHQVDFYDFQKAFLEASGFQLEWFFKQWVLRGGEPEYQVSYKNLSKNDEDFTQVLVQQIHDTDEYVGLFKMPIVIEVHYQNGSYDSVKVNIEKQTEIIEIQNPKKLPIAYVLFDPNRQIIKKIQFKKSWEELKAQSEYAPHMIDRFDALTALQEIDMNTKKEHLIYLFSKEKFHGCRAEIARQLAPVVATLEAATVQKILNDKHPDVRNAFLDATTVIPPSFQSNFEALLQDSSYQNIALALIRLSENFPDERKKYLNATEKILGNGSNVLVARLKIAAEMNQQGAMVQLIALGSNQYEFRTRTAAFSALKQLNYFDESLCKNIFQAITHFNTRLNSVAIGIAQHFYAQKNYAAIMKNYYENGNWDEKEKKQLKKIFE